MHSSNCWLTETLEKEKARAHKYKGIVKSRPNQVERIIKKKNRKYFICTYHTFIPIRYLLFVLWVPIFTPKVERRYK